VRLTPPIKMTLEKALAYIEDDELVEVTPKSIRPAQEVPRRQRPQARRKGAPGSGVIITTRETSWPGLTRHPSSLGVPASPCLLYPIRHSPLTIRPPMSLPSEVNVAIIGAGAAGLGAAHALQKSNLSFIVLEGRDRVGGRAHTIQASPDITFDLGCGWLHSANENSFVPIAEQLNFEVDKTRPPWREQAHHGAFPPDQRAEFLGALDAFYDRAEIAAREAKQSGRDAAANLYLEPGNR
jgi:hypothetical protein